MTNYSEMNVAHLRQIAKRAKVSGWWNMTKADLIAALTPDKVLPVETITVDFTTGEVTLKMICGEITPRKARKMLRKVFGAKHSRWTFNADEVNNIKKIIGA